MQIQSLIDFINESKLAGIIMFIDFEKAYDLVHWVFLIESLRCFNFEDKFIKWIKILYSDVQVKVRNGNLTHRDITCPKRIKTSRLYIM